MIHRIVILIILLCGVSACSTMKTFSDNNNDDDNNRKVATARINVQLGIAYLERHDIQRAKRKLLFALDEAPHLPETWYSMGYFLETVGERKEAKKYYLKAIALAPNRGDVHNNYGTYLCRSKYYHAAIQQFILAVKDPEYLDNAAAYENAGLCALKIPNWILARRYFKRALAQDPKRSIASAELTRLNHGVQQNGSRRTTHFKRLKKII